MPHGAAASHHQRTERSLIDSIDEALSANDELRCKDLLAQARDALHRSESLVVDLLAQNPDYKAHAGLRARLNTFVTGIGRDERPLD